MNSIIEKLNDGGPGITIVILIVLLIILALFVKAVIEKKPGEKSISLIASLGWFALAWGYLGRTLGLIMAFDKIAAAGEITPSLMAGGLKMALVGPFMALLVFAIARVEIIVLTLMKKRQEVA